MGIIFRWQAGDCQSQIEYAATGSNSEQIAPVRNLNP
jgi:hypothetical protein